MKRFSAHFGTPSAINRQMQRLEAALGADLLDRSIKPPRLNSLGFRCSNKREIWRLRLLSELTSELFPRLAGELEAAVVLLLERKTAPPPLPTNFIASDRMKIVQGAAETVTVIGQV